MQEVIWAGEGVTALGSGQGALEQVRVFDIISSFN